MTERTSLLAACFRRLPEDAYSMTVTAGAVDDVPGCGPGENGMTRDTAADIMVRADLARPDQCRILAMSYPVERQVFWQILADLGVTQERLMERMGASP
ncbi:MAG TPA: hypothetical protein VFV73_38035 [Streptosporangiaceae bacterium]|nr:hypothetical protein [Streptosporangiaceae bacterium]